MTTGALLGWLALTVGLTLVPGADTAVVLRAAVQRGPAFAVVTGAGVAAGVLAWGVAAAAGLAAVVTASPPAYDVVRWGGAAYLVWLGLRTLADRRPLEVGAAVTTGSAGRGAPVRPGGREILAAFGSGLLTNLLNPKIGVFYLSVLPQFLPGGTSASGWSALGWGALLAGIHDVEGMVWFTVIAFGVHRARALLQRRRVLRTLDGVVGASLVGLGIRLAVSTR